MEIVLIKKNGRLEASDVMSSESLASIKEGREVLVTLQTPRSPRQLRWFWALCEIVAQNCEWLDNQNAVANYLKYKAKHVDWIGREGQQIPILRSIAYGSMAQEEFNQFANRCVWYVCNDIIPGMNENELRNEVLAMVGALPKENGATEEDRIFIDRLSYALNRAVQSKDVEIYANQFLSEKTYSEFVASHLDPIKKLHVNRCLGLLTDSQLSEALKDMLSGPHN